VGRVRFDSIPRHFHEITKDTKDAKKQTDLFHVFVGFVFFVVKESPGSQKIKRSGGLLVVQERELGSGARRPRGKTVFLTTHLMEEAERLCDRVPLRGYR